MKLGMKMSQSTSERAIDVTHVPQKEDKKILQDVTKHSIVKDHVKWVKIRANEEDSTCNCNIANNKELTSIKSS